MQINVTGRHFAVTEPIKKYIQEKLLKLDRYSGKIIEVHITLSVEKYRHDVEITLLTKGSPIKVSAESEDMYASVDKALDKIQTRLKRYAEKLKRHNTKHGQQSAVDFRQRPQVSSSVDSGQKLVRAREFSVKPMSVEEAGLQMGLTTNTFLVFRNAATDKINVIYRRKDGNYGLIET